MTQVVLVDEADKLLGLKEKFLTHHNPVPLHRAISIIIYNHDQSQILITKRAKNKPTWPGYWSNAVCTHPLPNESYLACAQRRLVEELGFACELKEVFHFIYEAQFDETWGEHELDHVFVGEYEGEVKPDPAEVVESKWIKIEDLQKDLVNHPDLYTPWFKTILEKL